MHHASSYIRPKPVPSPLYTTQNIVFKYTSLILILHSNPLHHSNISCKSVNSTNLHLSLSMATKHQLFLSLASTAIFFFLLILLPPKSGGIEASSSSYIYDEQLRKLILGSRPPACVNKCMSCRPCEATLVIPPHDQKSTEKKANNYEESFRREDGSYYLLSWKCRCGNKLYHP